jgi:hypothetical protein
MNQHVYANRSKKFFINSAPSNLSLLIFLLHSHFFSKTLQSRLNLVTHLLLVSMPCVRARILLNLTDSLSGFAAYNRFYDYFSLCTLLEAVRSMFLQSCQLCWQQQNTLKGLPEPPKVALNLPTFGR